MGALKKIYARDPYVDIDIWKKFEGEEVEVFEGEKYSDREIKGWLTKETYGRRTVRYLTLTVGVTKNVGWNYICGSLLRLQKMLSQTSYFTYWGKGDARHVHLLVVAPWLSQRTWSDLWRLCSKYRVVYIKQVKDIDDLIRYIRVHPYEVSQFVND